VTGLMARRMGDAPSDALSRHSCLPMPSSEVTAATMARFRPGVSAGSLLLPLPGSGGAAWTLSDVCATGTKGGGWNTASTPQSVCVRSVPPMAVTVSVLLQHLRGKHACLFMSA
jgi:hypothetical protein